MIKESLKVMQLVLLEMGAQSSSVYSVMKPLERYQTTNVNVQMDTSPLSRVF
jgi:hypothetical protein